MDRLCPLCCKNHYGEPSYDNLITVRIEAVHITANIEHTKALELEDKCCYECYEQIENSEKKEKVILIAAIAVISMPLWIALLFSRPPAYVSMSLIIAGMLGFFWRVYTSKDRSFNLPPNSSLYDLSKIELFDKLRNNLVIVRTR